jgi:hypothetical protein
MCQFEEPPAGWVPVPPPDDDDVVPVDEVGCLDVGGSGELSCADEVALVEDLESEQRRFGLARIEEMHPSDVLADLVTTRRETNLSQVRELQLAAQWADLHGTIEAFPSGGPGCERLITVGGDGTPQVGEFAPAEFGAVLGLSTVSGRNLIADALDLRHRLPRTWARVQEGTVTVTSARRVAYATRELPAQAAARVDATGWR